MPYVDNNQTALTIINKVLLRLGVSEVSTLSQNKQSIMAVGLLNDVLDDIGDHGTGHWPQLYLEDRVVLVSGQVQYKLNFDIKTLEEVAVSGQVQAMVPVTKEEIRRLNRTNSLGTPRFYAGISVSGLAMSIRVHPRPSISSDLLVSYYTKPIIIRASAGNNNTVLPFPSTLITQGLYAAMLLEQAGGSPTNDSLAAATLFTKMKTETFNRYTSDVGTDIQFTPYGGR